MSRAGAVVPWGLVWPLRAALGLLTMGVVAFTVSSRPGAMVIRSVFNSADVKQRLKMEPHAPDEGVRVLKDVSYRAGDPDATLDVYLPEDAAGAGTPLPTVIWIHGGGWVSGSKDHNAPYFRLIAAAGFVVVAPDYGLAPERKYPTAVHQLNEALTFVRGHADRYHLDPDRIVLAGDSAGAQLASQLAVAATNHSYAIELGITPALTADALCAVVLSCGIFDCEAFLDGANLIDGGPYGWGNRITMWAYTGSRRQATNIALRQMSTIDHVTANFPPAFVTGGNDDPLTRTQSRPFAARLEKLGVEVETRFFPWNHPRQLGHEYQFELGTKDGQETLDRILAFMRRHTKRPTG